MGTIRLRVQPRPLHKVPSMRFSLRSASVSSAPVPSVAASAALRLPSFNRWCMAALMAAGVWCAVVATPAHAQSEASAALSVLPVASVVGLAGATSAAGGAVAAVPAALSVGGAVLVVKSVEASATGTVYLLERASDGAKVSVEVVGRGAGASAHAVGSAVTCSVVTTGVVLSVAGEALAFIPNAMGRALLHNERL